MILYDNFLTADKDKFEYRSNKKLLEAPLQQCTKTVLFPITTKAAVCRHCRKDKHL